MASEALAQAQPKNHYDSFKFSRRIDSAKVSWISIFRFVLYQTLNDPWRVAKDRAAVLLDLYATAYASFVKGYSPWGVYYGPYWPVFACWSVNDLDQAKYSPGVAFARAQAGYYQRPAVACRECHDALVKLHHMGSIFCEFVWRPLLYLALPLSILVLFFGRRSPRLQWVTLIIILHLAIRAFLFVAEERYQLPIDFLICYWIALLFCEIPRIRRGVHLSS